MKQQFTIVIAMLCLGLSTVQSTAQAALVDGLKENVSVELEKTPSKLTSDHKKGSTRYVESSWEVLADSLFDTGIEMVIFMLPSKKSYTEIDIQEPNSNGIDTANPKMRLLTEPQGKVNKPLSHTYLTSSETLLADSTKVLIQRFDEYLSASLVNSISNIRFSKQE